MIGQITYRKKRFLIEFIIYGLPFSLLMWLMNLDDFGIGSFLFHFVFYGGFMAFFMAYIEKKSLQKIGLTFNENTLNEYQERKLPTILNKSEFYDFWNKSDTYKVIPNDDGSLDVSRRYYTSEFKETIIVSYQSDPTPFIIFRSKPQKWFGNNIALIHKTIESVKEYAENNIKTFGQ